MGNGYVGAAGAAGTNPAPLGSEYARGVFLFVDVRVLDSIRLCAGGQPMDGGFGIRTHLLLRRIDYGPPMGACVGETLHKKCGFCLICALCLS